jgi:hypothetical protein
MKKLLLFTLVAFLFISCSKSGGTVKPGNTTNVTGLSGKYAVFKNADTMFADNIRSHGVSQIEVLTLNGDTIYQNVGTVHPTVSVNIIENYSPDMIADTLTFNSSTAGIESGKNATYPFKYSLSTGAFDDGDTTPNVHYILTRIDDSTVKLVIYEIDGIYTGDVTAAIYRKL